MLPIPGSFNSPRKSNRIGPLLTRATHITLRKQQLHTKILPTIKQPTSTSTWTMGTIRRQNEAVVTTCRPQYEGDHEALFSASTITPQHIPPCQRPRPNYIPDGCANCNWGTGLHRPIMTFVPFLFNPSKFNDRIYLLCLCKVCWQLTYLFV